MFSPSFTVIAAESELKQVYKHIILGDKPTRYKINEKNYNSEILYEIKAIGDDSASGLYIEAPKTSLLQYPKFSWSWTVNKIQKNADISIKDKEDFAASIQFIFGKPSLLSRPKILAYAWVGNNAQKGTIIPSPRIPKYFKTIILDNSKSELNTAQFHKRNILEDYKKAYGAYPTKELSTFGVFTDNDQTAEPVEAIYQVKLKNTLLE